MQPNSNPCFEMIWHTKGCATICYAMTGRASLVPLEYGVARHCLAWYGLVWCICISICICICICMVLHCIVWPGMAWSDVDRY